MGGGGLLAWGLAALVTVDARGVDLAVAAGAWRVAGAFLHAADAAAVVALCAAAGRPGCGAICPAAHDDDAPGARVDGAYSAPLCCWR